jgi:hypothetical protein
MSAITTCHCGEVLARRLQVKTLPMPEQAPAITAVLVCIGDVDDMATFDLDLCPG